MNEFQESGRSRQEQGTPERLLLTRQNLIDKGRVSAYVFLVPAHTFSWWRRKNQPLQQTPILFILSSLELLLFPLDPLFRNHFYDCPTL